jgi:four helix bundle protein
MVLRANPRKLGVYQIASEVATHIIRHVRTFPRADRWTVGDQLRRAAVSVPANLAEACGRGTVPEFRRFLLFARGSAQEVVAILRVARRAGLGDRGTMISLESKATLVVKMITRLHQKPPPDR